MCVRVGVCVCGGGGVCVGEWVGGLVVVDGGGWWGGWGVGGGGGQHERGTVLARV